MIQNIQPLLDALVNNFDDGVVMYRYYPVTELWELNVEDVSQACSVLTDVLDLIEKLNITGDEDVCDLHCIFTKRITRIYLYYKDENITEN